MFVFFQTIYFSSNGVTPWFNPARDGKWVYIVYNLNTSKKVSVSYIKTQQQPSIMSVWILRGWNNCGPLWVIVEEISFDENARYTESPMAL